MKLNDALSTVVHKFSQRLTVKRVPGMNEGVTGQLTERMKRRSTPHNPAIPIWNEALVGREAGNCGETGWGWTPAAGTNPDPGR